MQRLEELRAQLRHFEQSPDFGDGDSVERIRQHLLLRIREAEGTIQTSIADAARRGQGAIYLEDRKAS
jgi:hypothetical protein